MKTRREVVARSQGLCVDGRGVLYGPRGPRKTKMDQDGYLNASFREAGTGKVVNVYVHRLQAFQKFGNELYADGMQVRHLDGNHLNNRPVNIAIGTKSDNEQDKDPVVRKYASEQGALATRKFTDDQVRDMRSRYASNRSSCPALAREYECSKSTMSYILNRKTYAHVDPLHPAGRCICGGEGRCSWCIADEARALREGDEQCR